MHQPDAVAAPADVGLGDERVGKAGRQADGQRILAWRHPPPFGDIDPHTVHRSARGSRISTRPQDRRSGCQDWPPTARSDCATACRARTSAAPRGYTAAISEAAQSAPARNCRNPEPPHRQGHKFFGAFFSKKNRLLPCLKQARNLYGDAGTASSRSAGCGDFNIRSS